MTTTYVRTYIHIYTDTNPITLPCSLAQAGKYQCINGMNSLILSTDIDECSVGSHNCKAELEEVCNNTVGGFECVCPEGFHRANKSSMCLGMCIFFY